MNLNKSLQLRGIISCTLCGIKGIRDSQLCLSPESVPSPFDLVELVTWQNHPGLGRIIQHLAKCGTGAFRKSINREDKLGTFQWKNPESTPLRRLSTTAIYE